MTFGQTCSEAPKDRLPLAYKGTKFQDSFLNVIIFKLAMKLSEQAKSVTDKLMGYFEADKKDEEEESAEQFKAMNLFGCSTNRSQERELFEKTNEEKMALFKEYK